MREGRTLDKIYVARYGGYREQPPKRWPLRLFIFCSLVVSFFAALWAFVELSDPQGFMILEYHKVNDRDYDSYTVHPSDFAEEMDELKAQGYTTISLMDYLRARKGKQTLPEKPIVVTFDDGYSDMRDEALPILEARGMKATLFMVTNDIGRAGYLTWSDLKDIESRGTEIGSHTANHLSLTGMLPSEAADEAKLSKLIMEWNGLKTIFVFSYPNGEYSEDLPKMLEEQEYLAAVTGDPGLNDFSTNPYLLQRVNIPRPRLGIWEFRLRLWKAKAFSALGIKQHSESIRSQR